MHNSQIQYDNASPKEWDTAGIEMLTDSECEEVQAIADDMSISFESAFNLWLEQVNKQNADAWEWQL